MVYFTRSIRTDINIDTINCNNVIYATRPAMRPGDQLPVQLYLLAILR